ncbi:MAG TPA: GNAT family N-acetyltransferase [Pyrinomonadaceae bacterium]|jgi:GNAT superfamily N-acetyltransferase|nr:GNAT family N-acetyltransferase [Pyrinomonadaceae bacterium]
MDTQELLALYDRDERIESVCGGPGVRRELTPRVIRHVNIPERESFIIYSSLDERTVEEAITEQIEFFESAGRSFEWKVFAHDRPADLKERLVARGFEAEETEAVMVLELEDAPETLLRPVTEDVRRVVEVEELRDVVAVQREVWGGDRNSLGEQLGEELQLSPNNLSVYVAYADGVAAAAAWLRFSGHSRFASLWGGSTLSRHRRKGLYTALLAARVQEARRRGVPFLTIDAGRMSRPVVEKYGFRVLTHATACRWRAKTNRVN